MNQRNYKWVVYFIGITIVATIIVQIYWNFREYEINKQNLHGKVQLSLDNAVEDYYTNLTKSVFITYSQKDTVDLTNKIDTILVKTKSGRSLKQKIDSVLHDLTKRDSSSSLRHDLVYRKDSSDLNIALGYPLYSMRKNRLDYISLKMDSLISKVALSFSRDSLDLKKLNDYVDDEFVRNHIHVDYALKFNYRQWIRRDSIIKKSMNYNYKDFPETHLTAKSKSNFLPYGSTMELMFTNETKQLLVDSLASILLSLLLSISIIACMVYLLKTIFKQKQLAEVKNDLISNITHEFKTPIATISTALEAMKSFNVLDDKVKSEEYISIANSQVNKLNIMVEKILETAALNYEELTLNKQDVNLSVFIENVIKKYELINSNKSFKLKNEIGNSIVSLDKFYFENAIGNIIDNATKYGGKTISVELTSSKNSIVIFIKDNGNGIHKTQKDKVFEQFYRVPTGNTHNVKGFGIGLFYTKNIIEKHGGSINIVYDKQHNSLFKIELPNG